MCVYVCIYVCVCVYMCVYVCVLKVLKVLKEIAFQIMEKENFTFHENRFRIYEYILDIIDSKFLTEVQVKKRKAPKT